MNAAINPPSNTAVADEDLAQQALPGHGIASQDPNAAAQVPVSPREAKREANSILAGEGALVGAAAGTLVKPEAREDH